MLPQWSPIALDPALVQCAFGCKGRTVRVQSLWEVPLSPEVYICFEHCSCVWKDFSSVMGWSLA